MFHAGTTLYGDVKVGVLTEGQIDSTFGNIDIGDSTLNAESTTVQSAFIRKGIDTGALVVRDSLDITNVTIVAREYQTYNYLEHITVGALNLSRMNFESKHLHLLNSLSLEDGIGIFGDELISEGDIILVPHRDTSAVVRIRSGVFFLGEGLTDKTTVSGPFESKNGVTVTSGIFLFSSSSAAQSIAHTSK